MRKTIKEVWGFRGGRRGRVGARGGPGGENRGGHPIVAALPNGAPQFLWFGYWGVSSIHWTFGPPLHCHWASAIRLVPAATAAPRLAVLGRPSAPWPGVPALRVPQVLVLTPCRARGLCCPPRVPAPAKRLGGQAASAWVRASRASAGRWGLLGRRPVWQTASSPRGVHASSCHLVLPPDKEGRPGRVSPAMSLICRARWRGWGCTTWLFMLRILTFAFLCVHGA